MAHEGLDGFAEAVLEDVVRAELSMHKAQIQGWAWMYKRFAPKGDHIPQNIMHGSAGNRYLGIDSLSIELYLKPVEIQTYWQRFKLGIGLIFGKKPHFFKSGAVYEYAKTGEQKAQKFNVQVVRDATGVFKLHYDRQQKD